MDDQLPNFDQGEDVLGEQPRPPKKPKPRPTRKKPAKKTAKVVVPKRPVRKRKSRRAKPVVRPPYGKLPAAPHVDREPLLTTKEFNTTLDIIDLLRSFETLIRRRIMDRLIKTFP